MPHLFELPQHILPQHFRVRGAKLISRRLRLRDPRDGVVLQRGQFAGGDLSAEEVQIRNLSPCQITAAVTSIICITLSFMPIASHITPIRIDYITHIPVPQGIWYYFAKFGKTCQKTVRFLSRFAASLTRGARWGMMIIGVVL